MELPLHSINWIEIPASDFKRAKKFYSAIYDFDMPEMQMGPNTMGILLYDQAKRGIGAAIVSGDGYVPSKNGPKVYLNGGSDLNTVLSRVENAGGKILLAKTLISPELGYFAVFEDSEGNQLSIHSMA